MKPTLEKVQKDLANFCYEIQMYCYHHMNGRIEEAQTYLDAYFEMQDGLANELQKGGNSHIEQLDSDLDSDEERPVKKSKKIPEVNI